MISFVGKRIKELRKRQGMTQKKLAYDAGLSQTFIFMIERQNRLPSLDALAQIARALSTEPAYLLQDAESSASVDYRQRLVAFAKRYQLTSEQVDSFIDIGRMIFREKKRKVEDAGECNNPNAGNPAE